MGKNSRERKEEKTAQTLAERQAIVERRTERLAGTYSLLRRFVVATVATVFLLYIGSVVNHFLPNIIERLAKRGV